MGVRREELSVQQGAKGCRRTVRSGLRDEPRPARHTGTVLCGVGFIMSCI